MTIAGNQINPKRHPYDDYPTDPAWTRVLLNNVKFEGSILEPAAGEGRMLEVLEQYYPTTGYDLERDGIDFLTQHKQVDNVVTNPPYRLADEFIQHGLGVTRRKLALLLPIGYLGGQKRYTSLFSSTPPAQILVVSNRMKVNNASSQFNHVWMVWDKNNTKSSTKTTWHIA